MTQAATNNSNSNAADLISSTLAEGVANNAADIVAKTTVETAIDGEGGAVLAKVRTSVLIDPRNLLLKDGFQRMHLRDGGGFQVFEKVSQDGKMIEQVMVRGDLEHIEVTANMDVLPGDGIIGAAGARPDESKVVTPEDHGLAATTDADRIAELTNEVAQLQINLNERGAAAEVLADEINRLKDEITTITRKPSDDVTRTRLERIGKMKKDDLLIALTKVVKGEDPGLDAVV